MANLLDLLAAEEILPTRTVLKLREYISKKHPSLSLASKAAIFADAVNRVIDGKTPEIPEEQFKQFKVFLFRDAAGKPGFCINGSDIFKSALRLRITDELFISGLGDWLEKILKTPVDSGKVRELVNVAYRLFDELPDTEVDGLIDMAEKKAGGIVTESIGAIAQEAASDQEAAEYCTESESGATEANGIQAVIPFMSDIKKVSPIKRKAFRAIAAAGLVGVSVLLSYYSAMYINATVNVGPSKTGDIVIVEQEDIPAGAVVLADPQYNENNIMKMTATAYDLSIDSCGKDRSHPAYGVTSSGTKATVGRTIAVDPDVIPLGSRVKITFPEKFSYLDGIYIAEDTGRLIKGNKVDVFFGEDKAGSKTINKLAMDFGVQNVEVEVLE